MIVVHLFDALIKLAEILSIALESIPADLVAIFVSNLSIVFVHLFQLFKLLEAHISFLPTVLLKIFFLECLNFQRLCSNLILCGFIF